MRVNIKAVICVWFSVSFFACRTDKANSEEVVIVQINQDPERLNPIAYPTSAARPINQLIFLPLAEYDPISLEYSPVMIKEMPKPRPYNDGVQYVMELLPEAVWTDGQPITGLDVAFTIKAALHPLTAASGLRSYVSNISSIEVDHSNKKLFTITFEEDYPLSLETATNFEILPAHIYDLQGVLSNVSIGQLKDTSYTNEAARDSAFVSFAENFNGVKHSREVVVGSGPYTLDKWMTNEAVVLKRKDNYWGSDISNPLLQAIPSTIVYKIIPDEVGAMAALKSGAVDILPEVDAEMYEQLKKDTSVSNQLQFHLVPIMRYYLFLLNNQDKVLNDKSVRQALSKVTNVDRYIQLFENGDAQRTISFINPAKKYYHKSLTPIPFDTEGAKALLSAAGWSDTDKDGIVDKVIAGKKEQLILDFFASGELGSNIGLLLKEDAAKAGIGINIISQDYAITRKNNLNTGDFDIIVSALTSDLSLDDPSLRFHSSNATLGGSNYAMYASPQVDSLIDVVNTEDDPQILQQAYYEIQELIYEDQPYIYLYVPQSRMVSNKKWKVLTSVKRPGYFPNTFESVQVTQSK